MSSPRNTLDILKVPAVCDEQAILDCMVEVELTPFSKQEGQDDDDPMRGPFLSVLETLTRIGVHIPRQDADGKRTLYQTCHILHKHGRYYIVHFKHLFMLDGRNNGFYQEDVLRMNRIIRMLDDWNMLKIKAPDQLTEFADMRHIKVVRHNEVGGWVLTPKYKMRHKRNHNELNRKTKS